MSTKQLTPSEHTHNGKLQWRVYFPKGVLSGGNAKYVWYQSKEEAEQAIQEIIARRVRFGELAKDVTVTELAEARAASQALAGTGFSALDAARHVKRALERTLSSRTVKEGLDAYHGDILAKYQERKANNPRCEPRHWRSVKHTIARLKPLFTASLMEITPDQVRPLFKKLTKASLKGHLRNLHAAFNYCIDEGWMDSNPVDGLVRMKADVPSTPRQIQTFTVDQTRRIMDAAAKVDIRTVPYFAICFFAGVRPEAALKMKWSDVSANGYIYVPHTVNKSGHAYNAQILPTLRSWISWWESQGNERVGLILPVSPSTLKRVRSKILNEAGLEKWVQDGTRKTFATAFREIHKCKILTSAALGHTGTTVLDEHYDSRLMTAEDAAAYWEIRPPCELIQIEEAA
jgi:integrase